MNNKAIALAVVGIMLSVCLAGVISYADNTDATDGAGTEGNPYVLPPVNLSELKDKAVVYFNLSYDKQFVTNDPVVKVEIKYTTTGDYTDYLTKTDGTLENYRYSNVLTATKFDADVEATVKYTVTITYDKLPAGAVGSGLTETVYYQASVSIHEATGNPGDVSMEFQGNVAYNGNWALDEDKYKGNESGDATVIFGKDTVNASFYSNNLPKGLYLKNVTDESGKVTGATIVGMLGSSVTANGEFNVYTITETDVLVTKVTYTVVDTDEGNGFKYSVSDNGIEIIKDASEGKTVLVKSGTNLTITTSVELTEIKVTNATDGSPYIVDENTNTYTIDGSKLSGTIKVFMTYNNGINDNRTIELTIIYIGSSSDASLVSPIVRSY